MKPDEQSLGQQAEEALQDAVEGVIEEARRNNGEVIVWENGAVRRILAGELPPSPSPKRKGKQARG